MTKESNDELELCKEWFCGYDTVVSSHDLLCRVLQFDVDGDEILLTPNKTMIECVPNDKHTLYYKSFDAVKSPVTKENIYKALVASMDNSNIGDISNAMTKNYNNENIDDAFNKIMCCYNNLTIDFPKTQHNISLGEYEEKYRKLTTVSYPQNHSLHNSSSSPFTRFLIPCSMYKCGERKQSTLS